MNKIECIHQGQDIVGEGIFWDRTSKRILWVDIIGKRIKQLDWQYRKVKEWEIDDFPTAAIPFDPTQKPQSERWVVSLAGGVYFFDPATSEKKLFSHPEKDHPENRLNEAKCDPQGRLWLGTMYNNINPDGSGKEIEKSSGGLFRVNHDGSTKLFGKRDLGIGNTMAWDLTRKRFYFCDTLAYTIYVYDYDNDSGEISHREVFAKTQSHGMPDGSCIDNEGYLWNARFGGSAVIRYNPNGEIDEVFEMPAKNITSCTFGGEDNQTLLITSARFTLTEEEIAQNPLEGGLFSMKTKHRGDNYYWSLGR